MRVSIKVSTKFLYLLILIELLPFTYGVTELSFTSVHFRSSPRYLSNFTIEIINGTIYTDFDLIRRLVPGLRCRLEFQLRLANAKSYQPLFHFDIDVCSTIVALKDHLLKSWYKSILKYGNFMENCPISTDHYYMKGWKLQQALIPKYLYPGDYKIVAFFYFGQYKKLAMMFVLELELEATVV
ncbi:uncharacterized protein LOC129242240 [Anastrepha obliqua]|uniref:uncharacterized protein LOC129242240 n=1 Tax=Anastrepha obliqua TaxID=95512 RepID=UPI00240918F2|nr:uncharacterized protein LOC129242240 [Anastrepha obliqua]